MSQNDRMTFTYKQGQYLAFIYYYIKIHQCPPSEADMQRNFKTTPPTVHNLIVRLEKKGLIEKRPDLARSIKVLLSEDEIPQLNKDY
jgi:DNA-binding MarR family transcriptional regulator